MKDIIINSCKTAKKTPFSPLLLCMDWNNTFFNYRAFVRFLSLKNAVYQYCKKLSKSILQEMLEMFNQYPTVKENSFVPKHPSYSVWLWVTACSVCEVDWNLVYFEPGRENSIDTSQLPPSRLAMSRHGYDTINESQDSIVVALRLPCSAESKLLKWRRSCFRSLAVHHAQTLHTHLLVASLSRSLKTCPRVCQARRLSFSAGELLYAGFTVIWCW